MIEKLHQLEEAATAAITAVDSVQGLEAFHQTYLGNKGSLKAAMAWLKQAEPADKPKLGAGLNVLKKRLEQAYQEKKTTFGSDQKQASTGPMIDLTEPGLAHHVGAVHVVTQVIDQLVDVFARMGFKMVQGPELEDEQHNFVALNIPMEHPARDPLDNFYLDPTHLLRTQTSTVQIRVMESTPPPIRIVSLGRVYRPDTHDATHSSMFHQIEGLYVDRQVSMVDLKTTLLQFAHAMFGPEAEVRLRPSYFPFTEPSAELDMKVNLSGKWEWVELGGCGMVDPAVFENVGYDPEQWQGFAFGLGIERIAMKRFGISDIRWLFENDVRFSRQF